MDEELGRAYAAKTVGVMTGWADHGADPSLAMQVLTEYVHDGGTQELASITVGLVNVCGQLLSWRREERGIDEHATLGELGRLYAGGRSP